MANTIRIRRRTSGDPGTAGVTLANAELAFNEVDGILYYGKGGTSTASSSIVAIGAELGANVATFLKTPSSANLLSAVSDETGTGSLVFGTSPTIATPAITFSTSATVTAGTNAQGQGALTSDYNVVSTAAASPSGVTLPTATAGRRIIVVNRGANPINIYPATGAAVDSAATNAAISLPVGGVVEFNASSATQWYSTSSSSVAVGSLTGLGTGVATFLATPSSANLASALTDEVGTAGAVVFSNSPTLTTPNIGAATATSVNKVTLTAPANSATLTIADGKTLTASNTLTFTGTDASSVAFGAGGTVAYTSNKLSVFAATTSAELAGVISDETGSAGGGVLVFSNGPTLTAPVLGTPASGNLSNCTNYPASALGGLGTGVATFLATPSSANLASAVTDETGSGALVFGTSPSFTTSVLTGSTSFDVFDTTATTINAFGAATSANIGYDSTDTATTSIHPGATASTKTATINIGTSGASGSTTNVNLGSTAGGTVTVNKDLTVSGNLTVSGTTTTVNSTVTTIVDPIITIGGGLNGAAPSTDDNKDRGVAFQWHNGSAAKLGFYGWDDSAQAFAFLAEATNSGEVVTYVARGDVLAGKYNKVTITEPASGATLTIADGKTLTASNTLTFTGTDASSVAFGAGGTVAYTSNKLSAFAATTSAELAGVISDETGSGLLVFATSPTLTTPNIGVATATSVNKVAITAPATSATLTIADGKTLTASNTLTFTGTDASSVAFGTGGTVAYLGSTNAFTGANTFTNATGQTYRQAATNDGIILKGRNGGSSSYAVTVDTATLSASQTLSLPNETGTVLTTASTTNFCTAFSNAGCAVDGGTF